MVSASPKPTRTAAHPPASASASASDLAAAMSRSSSAEPAGAVPTSNAPAAHARLVLDDDRRSECLLEGLELPAHLVEGAPVDRGERVAGHPGRRRAAGHAEHAGGLERLEERRGHRGVDGDVAAPAALLGRRRHVRREHAPLGHVTIGARVRGVEEEDGQAAAHVLPGHEGEAVRLAHEVELDRDHGATSS